MQMSAIKGDALPQTERQRKLRDSEKKPLIKLRWNSELYDGFINAGEHIA